MFAYWLFLPVFKRLPPAVFYRLCLFAALLFCFFGGALPAAAQQWFPANAVSCNLSGSAINLGVFSRINEQPPTATGDWGVNCTSNAYPEGYPLQYSTLEGAFCVTIDGAQADRVLRGEGKNRNISIPFDFYFSRSKGFTAGDFFKQDYNSPIGNGNWGIAYIDWNYGDGDRRMAGRSRPRQFGSQMPLPGHGRFDLRFSPVTAGKAYPAGIYTANFPFRWKAGATRQNGQYPSPSAGANVCSKFPGSTRSGMISVRMEVKKYCNVAVRNNIDFGRQALLDKPLTAEGKIAVDCSNGTHYGIAVNNGLHSDSAGQRAMKRENGAEKIIYDIYQDSALKQPWKSDWSGASVLRAANDERAREFPVFARVPPQQAKPAGIYKDTLIVEVRVLD